MMEVGGSLPPFLWGGDIAKAVWSNGSKSSAWSFRRCFRNCCGPDPSTRPQNVQLARAGTAYSAKILCSGVLMAGIDANRLKREDLAFIQTQIDVNRGVVHA